MHFLKFSLSAKDVVKSCLHAFQQLSEWLYISVLGVLQEEREKGIVVGEFKFIFEDDGVGNSIVWGGGEVGMEVC